MRILICSEQPPVPPANGVRLVVRALIRELALRHQIRLLCFGAPNRDGNRIDGPPARIVENSETRRWNVASRLGRAILTGRPMHVDELQKAMRAPLDEELQSHQPDVVHVMAEGLAGLGRHLADRAAVLVPQDAAHRVCEVRAFEYKGLRRRLLLGEAERVKRFEADAYRRFNRIVVVTEEDRDALQALDPNLIVDVIPNGVDAEFFTPSGSTQRRRTVVFHGVMNFGPNVRAAEYLATRVWPDVLRLRRDAELAIVGRAPVRKVRSLSAIRGVEVTGEVQDVRPWLRGGGVYVCPMLSGTGIKNKLLEAMACGMACVATPLALRGMRAVPGRDLLVADGADALATQIAKVLDDDALAARLGQAAREYVRVEHDWAAVARSYEDVYAAAIRDAMPA
jgi:polysaccharide biosynthesis protein PslH